MSFPAARSLTPPLPWMWRWTSSWTRTLARVVARHLTGAKQHAPQPPLRFAHAAPGTRVIFVRHGHVHNPEDVIYGRMPRMRLSERGHDDMERTSRAPAPEPIAAIYNSPPPR